MPSLSDGHRTDTGSVPTCGLSAESHNISPTYPSVFLHQLGRNARITYSTTYYIWIFMPTRAERPHNIFYDILYLDIYANSGGTSACRDRPRVCPIPMPIRSTDRITYFAPALWFGIYYAVLVGRRADSKSPLGVCPYIRPIGRVGNPFKPNSHILQYRDVT